MPSKEDLKRRADEIIDAKSDDLISIAKTILSNPEPGFREVKTAKLVAEQFGSLGLQPRSGLAITGVRADASGSTPGPTMAVLGELDSLIVGEHPHADPNTNAAHACGHHCQIAMMLGAASALTSSDILESLAGRIAFMAVPAEEYIEIEYRDGLRKDGKIEFLGGKPEMVRLGEFDDVHLAMMLHTTSNPAEQQICISNTNNGSVAKRIQFIGRASHAGGAPHLGVNALNAAMMAMTAINFNRETFRDEDSIRVHPIITKGGEAVSAVPADVRMATFVRGRNLEALMDANTKGDRALRAGAMAVGADVKIQTIPGYMPLQQHKGMAEIFRANAVNLVGEDNVSYVNHRGGSTDMGDISRLMPVIHPYIGGAVGLGHGATYVIEDYSLAVIKGAKALAYTVIDLLGDNAAHGNSIVGGQRPDMSISEYLKFMRNLASEETYKGG